MALHRITTADGTLLFRQTLPRASLQLSNAPSLALLAALLERHMSTVTMVAGEALFEAGTTMDSLYIVESGRLRMEQAGGRPQAGGCRCGSSRVRLRDKTCT